ncbi:hypothetical protein [Chitinophaga sancti]|uniref:Uncharacterized protein n=1 Tax=Chitinophaga sancti TaxID=1004 RepID=A0A1K1SST6_9BACT|nr:hypothetical protein [Chitinophaga sancti]WQD65414.1 hypothetical protein U0033_13515 [Chitinophaga sancti]WQG88963.1 hypothetical protein SR876_28955 [Chitinophaga sancti]SFW87350.1 hypothetical protein SAMN05661012_06056 [Chitinophaga sancti]
MSKDDNYDYDEETYIPVYRPLKEIEQYELVNALGRLTFFKDDSFLRMQAHNLALVDLFLMDLEYKILAELIETERTPLEAMFLSAQSQMWIFSIYELMRTWKQRVSEIVKWSKAGGLELKIKYYEEMGYNQQGRLRRAKQLKQVLADKSIVGAIENDLRLIHVVYSRLEAIRVLMAKHELVGNPKSVAFMPGYGRINRWCGSLDYELENETAIIGYISRRDIADEVRGLIKATPMSEEDVKAFDLYMRGPKPNKLKDLF